MIFRQGDVLLKRVEVMPDAPKVEPEANRTVLAYGEVTGHCHTFDAEKATLYRDEALSKTWVVVTEATDLVHGTLVGGPGDHNPVLVDEGVYEVVIAREYSPEAVRNVID